MFALVFLQFGIVVWKHQFFLFIPILLWLLCHSKCFVSFDCLARFDCLALSNSNRFVIIITINWSIYKNQFHSFQAMLSSETAYEFTDDEQKRLNSTPVSQESDSLYMRNLIEILYKDNRNVLNHRSLSGRTCKQNKDQKCISPEKKEIIFNQFLKRLENPKISLQERSKRMDSVYIGRRIAVAIGTIRKSLVNENASGLCLPSE